MDITREGLEQVYSRKSDEALLDIHATGHLADLAFEVLEEELATRGMAVPARPEPTPEDDSPEYPRTTLRTSWEGKAPLFNVYWGVGFVGSWLVSGLAVVVALLLDYATGRTSDRVLLVPYLFIIPWTAFVSVAVWRCAWNTRHKGWGYVARAVVVLGVLQLLGIVVALEL